MRIRNVSSCALYLPYAGPKRGFKVKAGGESPHLPSDRFYDPLLQRDWKRGTILVLLSEQDEVALGLDIEGLKKVKYENYEVERDTVEYDPSPRVIRKRISILQRKKQEAAAREAAKQVEIEKEEEPAAGPEPVEPCPIQPEPVEPAVSEPEPEEPKPEPVGPAKQPEPPPAYKAEDSSGEKVEIHCCIPDCANSTNNVKKAPNGAYMCRFHRASYARHSKKANKEEIKKADEAVEHEDPVLASPPPVSVGSEKPAENLSISDLMGQNASFPDPLGD
jgi:hypothetical protein